MYSKPLVLAALLSAVVGCGTATPRGNAPLGYRPRGTAVSVAVHASKKASVARPAPAPAKTSSAKGSVIYGGRAPRAAVSESPVSPPPQASGGVQPQSSPALSPDVLEIRRKRLKSLLEMQMIERDEYERRLKGLQ